MKRPLSRSTFGVVSDESSMRACRRAILGGLFSVLLVCGTLAVEFPSGFAIRFAAGSIGTWLIVAWILWVLAADESALFVSSGEARAGFPAVGVGSVDGRLGAATQLTILRGFLVSLLAGFLFVPQPPARGVLMWMPGLLYAAAGLSDHYDGILARRLAQVTDLGRRLDVTMDALGLLVAGIIAVRWHRLPALYLCVGAAYYVFNAGLATRRYLGWPLHRDRLRPYRGARFFAGVHMVLCAAALLPPTTFTHTRWPSLLSVVAIVAMCPTLAFFIQDWVRVVGQRSPSETFPR